ncbi:RanBD1 domain-containing protein [Haematococcus lacustris]|uniref:RanBD1 domain-containing protein n=1 Tax=Haematococcus lacustris TaxID=44745 RepID=A0A699ZME0_HAELA|nr:RanBD1 domain-containing protein [Haematococcus lacustris]
MLCVVPLHAADGSLFEFDTAAAKWRERGKGEFKVNKAEKGMARMVMRQAANLRLLLNAKVYPGMPVQLMPSNVGVTFGVVNAVASHQSESGNADKKETTDEASNDVAAASASTAAKPTTWALKIKNPERVTVLAQLLTELRKPPAADTTADAAAPDSAV